MEQCENQPAERKVYYWREWLFSDLDNELNRSHDVVHGLGLSLRRRLKYFAAAEGEFGCSHFFSGEA